ncbi:MAG TPA: SAM-dependent methyltransferase [Acidocella sp.]|nr:SAM-dependent methyltransferase [Acidocella sp.]HQU04071.1 SAM-dependent methyltransferase [Acidocella sp.]
MARANAAYYATHNPFEDFTTAPELTQVFGEILGAWARVVAQMMGNPADLQLVEAGAGRGIMMADMLRGFGAANVHFIETSPRLRAEQAKHVPNAIWHDNLTSLPNRPTIFIANEFLDALPVRQFIRRAQGWCERYVADGIYVEQVSDIDLPAAPEGSVQEINEAAGTLVTQLAEREVVGLFIDYGPLQGGFGESVQAIRNGKYANPLEAPGQADITAHVDFSALVQSAATAGAQAQGPVKLNAFLTALGFMQRTDILAQRNPAMSDKLRRAAQRITAPEAMGSLFKVLAICPKGFPTLPGFEV